MSELSNRTGGMPCAPAVNKRITRIFQQIHAGMRKSRPPFGRGRPNDQTMDSRPGDVCSGSGRRGTGHGPRRQLPERQGAPPARGRCAGHLRQALPCHAAFLHRELHEAARRTRRRRVRRRAFRGGQRRRHGRNGEEGRRDRHRRRQRHERVFRPGLCPFVRRSARAQARGRCAEHRVRDPSEENPSQARPEGRHRLHGGPGGTRRAAPESHGGEQGLRRRGAELAIYDPGRAAGHEEPGEYRGHSRALSGERRLCAARLGRLSRPAARALHRRLRRVAALGQAAREPGRVRGDLDGQTENLARRRRAHLPLARRPDPRVHSGRGLRHGGLPQSPRAARRDRGRKRPAARKIPRPFVLSAGDRHARQVDRLRMSKRRGAWICVAIGLMLVQGPGTLLAQDYPSGPLRIVVPFQAGGSTDMVARTLGQKLKDRFDQPVVVENRAGANGTIGAALVAKSPPDGHTMLLVQSGYVSNPILFKNLPYDQARDLAPVSSLASGPMILVVHPSLPAQSVRELVAVAKSRPGELNFGSPGSGSLSDLCAQLFDAMAGVRMTHVPYKGSGGALADVLAGRVPVYYMNLVLALPYLKDERLRALGVTTPRRSAVTPDLPTIDEAGLPGYEMTTWYGLFVQGATPRGVIAKLQQEVAQILNQPAMKKRIAADGMTVVASKPGEFAEFLKRETEKYTRIIEAG